MVHFDASLIEEGSIVLANYISKGGYWLQINGVTSMESLEFIQKIGSKARPILF